VAVEHVKVWGWSGGIDAEGYREYTLQLQVKCAVTDGPATVLAAVNGAYPPGSPWAVFGNDADFDAYRKRDATAKPEKPGERGAYWMVELTYSSKPEKYCQDATFDNPLLTPQRVSGGFSRHKQEATHDRFGVRVLTSSWEPIRGDQNEWDVSDPQVKIEQSVPFLQLDLCADMLNRVNSYPMWGLPRRTVKLSDFSWDQKFYGLCYQYYTRSFTFDIKPGGWDRDLLDEGTKCLSGKWNTTTGAWDDVLVAGESPDPLNPAHFIRFPDKKGNHAKCVLDGSGRPYNPLPQAKIETICGECGTLAETYTVFGAGFGGDVTHDFDCEWSGVDAYLGGTMTLAAASQVVLPAITFTQWALAHSDFPGAVWTNLSTWNCLGANLMTQVAVGALAPAAVLVVPKQTSQPGRRRVEKYDEANFFLLGIPLFF
jgi:hypothetical protein